MEMISEGFTATELTSKGWWEGVTDDVPIWMSSKGGWAEAGLNTEYVQENLE